VDPVPDPLLLRKSGSAENRTRELLLRQEKDATFIIREICTFLLILAKIWSIFKRRNYKTEI
jgi:hypothetical protein